MLSIKDAGQSPGKTSPTNMSSPTAVSPIRDKGCIEVNITAAQAAISHPSRAETDQNRSARFGSGDVPKDPAIGVVFSDMQRERAYVNRLLQRQEHNASILKAQESEIFASFLTKKEKLDRLEKVQAQKLEGDKLARTHFRELQAKCVNMNGLLGYISTP